MGGFSKSSHPFKIASKSKRNFYMYTENVNVSSFNTLYNSSIIS